MKNLVRAALLTGVLCLTAILTHAPNLNAQAPPVNSGAVIHAESRLVVVDTIVTDKKGEYVRDLQERDFKVFEDGKEQPIKSFSTGGDAANSPGGQRQYMVLFFDNSTMDFAMQSQARQAAARFIDSNAGPNRLMAIANYGGSLQIAQNFTADADRLKKVVSGVKFSSVSPNGDDAGSALANSGLSNAAQSFGIRSVILGLNVMAKNLAPIPGRKSLILLTAGFPVTDDLLSDVTALINVCNRSNVAVYPIDARGLVANLTRATPPPARSPSLWARATQGLASLSSALSPAAFSPAGTMAFGFQRGGPPASPPSGGGGGRPTSPPVSSPPSTGSPSTGTPGRGTPTTPGTPSTPGRGTPGTPSTGSGGTPTRGVPNPSNPGLYNNLNNNLYNQPRSILIPKFPESASTNQQFMYMLASGTGGFVIANTNDMLAGLQKIGRELNEYYLLGYTPPVSDEGSCHKIAVKTSRGGTIVRARSGYCVARPVDVLAGSASEKTLEAQVAGSTPGSIKSLLQAPYFFTAPNTARVNVAMEIPADSFKFEKEKGKFYSRLKILGIAYRADGGVAARFSDSVELKLDDKNAVKDFKEKPLHYEGQFDIGSGSYTLKVVVSTGGESFGRVEAPLVVDTFDAKQFSLSGVALSKSFVRMQDLDTSTDADSLEDRKRLISQGLLIVPTGSPSFLKSEPSLMYIEIYAPILAQPSPPGIALQLKIVDRASGQSKTDTGWMNLAALVLKGNPIVPVGMKLPIDKLEPGAYRAELKAVDMAGHSTGVRTADFEIR